MRLTRAALRLLVALGAAGLAVGLLVPLGFLATGQRLLVVSSRSMAPALEVGDVVVLAHLNSVSDLHPGLLVAFRPPGARTLVTHRVVSAQVLPVTTTDPSTGRATPLLDPYGRPVLDSWLVTKGDANTAQDPDAVRVEQVAGVGVDVLHGWGPTLTAVTSPAGRAAFAVPALLALGALELLDRRGAARRGARS